MNAHDEAYRIACDVFATCGMTRDDWYDLSESIRASLRDGCTPAQAALLAGEDVCLPLLTPAIRDRMLLKREALRMAAKAIAIA